MVNKRPRILPLQRRDEEYEQEMRDNPPVIIWELVPNSGGLRIAIYVQDPPVRAAGRQPRPPCGCNLYGAPRRLEGSHHDETCGRWAA